MRHGIALSHASSFHPLVPQHLVQAARPYAQHVTDVWLGSKRESMSFSLDALFDGLEKIQRDGILGTAARCTVVATDASIIAAGTLATMLNPFALAVRPVETCGRILRAGAWWHAAEKTEQALAAPAANILANLLGAGLHVARETLQSGQSHGRGGHGPRPHDGKAMDDSDSDSSLPHVQDAASDTGSALDEASESAYASKDCASSSTSEDVPVVQALAQPQVQMQSPYPAVKAAAARDEARWQDRMAADAKEEVAQPK